MFGAAGTDPVNSATVWEPASKRLQCMKTMWIPSGLLSQQVPDKISGCKTMASLPSQASDYTPGWLSGRTLQENLKLLPKSLERESEQARQSQSGLVP